MLRVEQSARRLDDLGDNLRGKGAAAPAKRLRRGDGAHHLLGRFGNFSLLLAIGRGNGFQHALEAGPAVVIVGRKVSSAIEGLALRREKRGQRPAALAAYGRNRSLVAAINLG